MDKLRLEAIEAVHYIANVANKQGKLFEVGVLFGDGSRWRNIGRSGFEIAYKAVASEIEKQAPLTA